MDEEVYDYQYRSNYAFGIPAALDKGLTVSNKEKITAIKGLTPSWKLNVGSGQRPFGSDWLNIDVQSKWSPDVLNEGSYLPFEDGSASIIVLHHVLEHFGLGEADALIRECHRVLQPSGSLLVFVPHLEAIFDAFRLGKIDEYTLLVNLYGAYMGDEADRHKWGIPNPFYLTCLLTKAAPWSASFNFDWRVIPGADLAKDWWVLAVEAIK